MDVFGNLGLSFVELPTSPWPKHLHYRNLYYGSADYQQLRGNLLPSQVLLKIYTIGVGLNSRLVVSPCGARSDDGPPLCVAEWDHTKSVQPDWMEAVGAWPAFGVTTLAAIASAYLRLLTVFDNARYVTQVHAWVLSKLEEITPEALMGRGTTKTGLQSQSSMFTPRHPEPAPEGSQTVPLPPRFPPATEGSMLYGYELVPSLFGPGEIVARFRDDSTLTFKQPTSIREAIDAFQFVAGALGLLHGVEILQYRIPPIACFATAQEEFGIRSALNYDKAMLSDSQIQQLTNDLHLTKPPEWIFKPSAVTPEWKANFQAENANVRSIFEITRE